jgi:glycosyltransferase involved in cell wall biosynthesis
MHDGVLEAKTMTQDSSSKLLIICPCFNEAETISALIAEIEALNEDFDILVVDDGSTDGTYEVAASKAMTVRLPVNLGIGGAVQTGYRYAVRHNYQYAIQIDGDGQHDPAFIRPLLNVMQQSKADLVVGTRYLEKTGFQSSFMRRLGARIIAYFTHLMFGFRPSDPTSGMRLANRSLIEAFNRDYPNDYPEPLSLCFALYNGYSVKEEPVVMRDREAGSSSIMGIKSVSYMIIIITRIFALRFAEQRGGQDAE